MPASTGKDRTYLREEERTVLQSLLEEWNSKLDKKSRDGFVSGVAIPKIQELNGKDSSPEVIATNKVAKVQWEKRVSAVYTWFKNHKPFKDRQVFKMERKIPLRRVVGKLRASAIDDIIAANNPDLPKGDKSYPGIYQQALTEYMNKMSVEDTQEMEQALDEWQLEGPPLDVRLKAAKKYGRKAIVNAHQILDKQMNIACITVSMVPDPDTGVMGVTCHDYIADMNSQQHGKRFFSFAEWSGPRYSLFMQQMIDYANYVKVQRSEEPEPSAVSAPFVFEAGLGELPLLPPPVHGVQGQEIAKTAKELLRAYFLRHYQLATGSENAKTPWALIGQNPSHFFDPACLPESFQIQDPSRMGGTAKFLISHLRQRQEEHGVKAFHVHHVRINNEMGPASYPDAARVALSNAPPAEPELIPTQDLDTPTKSKPSAKTKTAAKSKTPVKSKKSPIKSLSLAKSKAPVKSNLLEVAEDLNKGQIKSESPQKLDTKFPSVVSVANGVTTVAPPTVQPNVRHQEPSNNQLQINPNYDPALMAQNNPQVSHTPDQDGPLTYHPGWAQNLGYLPRAAIPPFNPAVFSDPRFSQMFQQAMSHWAGPHGLDMAAPKQELHDQNVLSFQGPNFPTGPNIPVAPPAIPPLMQMNPPFIPSQPVPPFDNMDPHPIPPGEPPFAPFPCIGPEQPTGSAGANISAVQNPIKKTPKKRKRADIPDTPCKKPSRSSNRTPTPRKIFEIE